jgi:hypothetical protein
LLYSSLITAASTPPYGPSPLTIHSLAAAPYAGEQR